MDNDIIAAIGTKTFRVDGMHCEKCSGRVTDAVNDIPGAAGVVDLKKGHRHGIP